MRAGREVSIVLTILVTFMVGCRTRLNPPDSSSESLPEDIVRSVEQQVRTSYSLPNSVIIGMGVPRPSEFPNYDAITVTLTSPSDRQKFEFLISRDRKTLVRLIKFPLADDPADEAIKAKIDTSGRPTRGNRDSKVTVITYDDFECPFCAKLHETLFPALLKKYGDRVLFIYKDFPLEKIHPWAVHAAVNANCLGEQNEDAYWDYADYLFSNQQIVSGTKGLVAQKEKLDMLATSQARSHRLNLGKFQGCLDAQDDKAVRASIGEGRANGVDSTPSMFIDGRKMDGAMEANELQLVLDQALTDEGVELPDDNPRDAKGKTTAALPLK